MRADDDEVGPFRLGRLDDRLAGVALPDEERHLDAHPPAAGDEVGRRRLALRADLVDARTRTARRAAAACPGR